MLWAHVRGAEADPWPKQGPSSLHLWIHLSCASTLVLTAVLLVNVATVSLLLCGRLVRLAGRGKGRFHSPNACWAVLKPAVRELTPVSHLGGRTQLPGHICCLSCVFGELGRKCSDWDLNRHSSVAWWHHLLGFVELRGPDLPWHSFFL